MERRTRRKRVTGVAFDPESLRRLDLLARQERRSRSFLIDDALQLLFATRRQPVEAAATR